MKRKHSRFALALLGALAAVPITALADRDGRYHHGSSYHDWARVIDVQPIYRHGAVSYPREVCGETVGPGYRSYTPSVVGGILGGVVGSLCGSGKVAITDAGVMLGASVGLEVNFLIHATKARTRGRWTEENLLTIAYLITGDLKHLPAPPFRMHQPTKAAARALPA